MNLVAYSAKKNYDAETLPIELKHVTTSGYNKFTRDMHNVKRKEKELVNKSDTFKLLRNYDLNI